MQWSDAIIIRIRRHGIANVIENWEKRMESFSVCIRNFALQSRLFIIALQV